MEKRFFVEVDVDLIKYILPSGIPRNSFVIIAGEGGTGKSILVNSIVKSFVSSGEPVVYVDYDDDPFTIIHQFKSIGFDPVEAHSKGLFFVIDGFSYMVKGYKPAKPQFVVDEDDPRDVDSTVAKLIKALDACGIRETGLMVIDSFNVFLNYHEASRVLELLKLIRANVSKARGVLTFVTLHTSTDYYRDFLNSVEHLVDGVVLTENVVQHDLAFELPISLRRILVKKMKGVPHRTVWTLYTIHDGKPLPVRIKQEG